MQKRWQCSNTIITLFKEISLKSNGVVPCGSDMKTGNIISEVRVISCKKCCYVRVTAVIFTKSFLRAFRHFNEYK